MYRFRWASCTNGCDTQFQPCTSEITFNSEAWTLNRDHSRFKSPAIRKAYDQLSWKKNSHGWVRATGRGNFTHKGNMELHGNDREKFPKQLLFAIYFSSCTEVVVKFCVNKTLLCICLEQNLIKIDSMYICPSVSHTQFTPKPLNLFSRNLMRTCEHDMTLC